MRTATTTLTAGESDMTWDAGLIADKPLIGIAKSATSVKVTGMAGTWDVTFNLLVKNYGNLPLSGLQVTDDLATTFLTASTATTFTVQSLVSPDFTESPLSGAGAYTGSGAGINLLTGVDTLPVGGQGTITLVVRVVPDQGSYLNTAIVSGNPPTGSPVTDQSQDGVNPDLNGNNNPTDDNTPTPITFSPTIFDPPFGIKILDASGLPVLHWTMVWINNTNIVGVTAAVSDVIPVGTTYVAGSIVCTPASALTTTATCLFEAPSGAYPRGRIVWTGVLGPDFGATDAASANNELTITFNVTVNAGITSVANEATIDSDLNGDHDTADAGEQRVAQAAAAWNAPIIPKTGFAPGRITSLAPQTVSYADLGDLWLEIPRLGVQMPIVGIPQVNGEWDVSWLGNQAGWLNGSAYPTWAGNSVMTGHVFDAFGQPGPFVHLSWLWYGDKIIVHAGGAQYVYEVREVAQVAPNAITSVLKHEDKAWVTLVTCRGYDEASNSYKYRILVRAVLVEVK
jgi:LPXTG-site transpeptidase (sortase) family protein